MHRQTLSQLLICSDPGRQPPRALCWQPLLKEPISALKLCTGFELDQTPELEHWPPQRLTVHSEQAPSPSYPECSPLQSRDNADCYLA